METARRSNFYVRSGVFALLSLAGAGFNYILYPVLAHILNTRDFGNFTVIVAISNQILAVLLAFNITSISLVKNNPEEVAREKAQVIQKVLLWFFLAISALVLILSPLIKAKLKIDSPLSFFILSLILLSCVPAAIWTGYLQGHKRLVKVGVYSLSGALAKFILAIALGAAFGAIGALWGVLAGSVVGLFILWANAGIRLPDMKSVLLRLSPSEKNFLSGLGWFIFQSILIVGGLGLLQNIDIVYAKAFFGPSAAGQYSGISILSNALYYVAFLLVWIILPEIEPRQVKQNHRVLASAYKLMALITIGALLVEIILRHSLTRLLLGHNFASLGQVLIFATLFQISLVAVALYAFYLVVLRSLRSLALAICVMAPCLVAPWFFHNSTLQMIKALWLSVLLGFGFYFIINMITGASRQHVEQ